MNKARKQTYKKGTLKRLLNDSFILSSARFVSSRTVRFFETGFLSPLFASFNAVDGFFSEKITGPLFEKVQLRKRFAMPARNAVSSAISRNSIMRKLAMLRSGFLNSTVRSVGMFMLVFGIYSAAIFLLKRYISSSLGVAAVNDIGAAAICFALGLLLIAFGGDKSIMTAVGNSLTGSFLLSGCLGVNDSALEKNMRGNPRSSIGIAFLLGTIFGVLTLFFTPLRILLCIGVFTVALVILNIPEFGLLLSVVTCSVLPLKYVAEIAVLAVVSFLFKCIRLKRNFRFGTADVAVLLSLVVLYFSMMTNGFNDGERTLLCFMLLYFVAKNTIVSEKLVSQSINAVSFSLFLGMSFSLLGQYAYKIPFDYPRAFAEKITANAFDGEMLAMLAVVVLPFVLAKGKGNLILMAMLLAVVFLTDSLLFYVLVLVSIFVYMAATKKAPAQAILFGGVVITPTIALAVHYAKSRVVTCKSLSSFDGALGIPDLQYADLWGALRYFGGIAAIVIIALSLLLIFQRIIGCGITTKNSSAIRLCGMVSSSALMCVVCSFIFNPFYDLRMMLVLWFIFGLCGSSTTVSLQYEKKEV